jgi:hypothetical protein
MCVTHVAVGMDAYVRDAYMLTTTRESRFERQVSGAGYCAVCSECAVTDGSFSVSTATFNYTLLAKINRFCSAGIWRV